MDNAISVTQVNNYIKSIFDAEYMLQNIFVYGEIGAYKISNGIAYFNLKDENSLISCVLFNANNFPIFDVGDQVVVRGSVGYYSKGGKLNLNAVSIEKFGIGLLYQKFLELKTELESLGYFDQEKKRPIPARVKRIGVVTSETGAVIRDIIDVSTRRNDTIDIVLYPVKVQGLGAEKEIACGIDFFSEYDKVDVVIVARGGGSLEDLQPYNTRIVADAVYRCNKPVVSAVGHETDYTITDFVSDLRAPTPSAAAELVTNLKSDDFSYMNDLLYDMFLKINNLFQNKINVLYNIKNKLDSNLDIKLTTKFSYLEKLLNNMERILQEKINKRIIDINELKAVLSKADIKSIMERGFARIFVNNKKISSVANVNVGDVVNIEVKDGFLKSEIKEKVDNGAR